MGRKNPDQREGNGRHNDQRGGKRLKPADHQDKDQQQNRSEGNPQVPKHLVGDMPFPVPFHGETAVALRQSGGVLGYLVALGNLEGGDCFAHLQNGIDRTFLDTGHVPDDIHHRHQVFMIDAAVQVGAAGFYQCGKRDQVPVGGGKLDFHETIDTGPVF